MGNSVMLNGVEYAGEQIAYKDSTYELVSKVAYLIGGNRSTAGAQLTGTNVKLAMDRLTAAIDEYISYSN